MSKNIEERVVEMRFDNDQFEKGARETIKTLDDLDKSLELKNAGKGLDELEQRSNKFSMDGIGKAVDTVGEKFSALEVLAISALQRIAHQGVDYLEKTIKEISGFNSIKAGFQKFGDTTTASATLVSQGYDPEEVNKQLERLNWFTDETSYNFVDMVGNIGKFTAAGQKLDDSVLAMQGIATWAALSGQNATTASRAMYQLSQAMSKGALRYDDYKSIQNANMDTQEFRQTAIDSAVALGVLRKEANNTYSVIGEKGGEAYTVAELFSSDALTRKKWLNSDVMIGTFKKYSSAVDEIYAAVKRGEYDTASEAMDAMGSSLDAFGIKAFKAAQEARTWRDVIDSLNDAVSTKWMNTFQYIIGDYTEATHLMTTLANELYDVFAYSGDRRNEILKLWHDGIKDFLDGASGRDALMQGFRNIWDAIINIRDMWRSIFEDIFPIEEAAKHLIELSVKFEEFTEGVLGFFAPFDDAAKEVEDSLDTIADAAEKVIDPIEKTKEVLDELANSVIRGDYGNGEARRTALEDLGYSYELVQNRVNELLGYSFRYEVQEKKLEEQTAKTNEGIEEQGKKLKKLTGVYGDAIGSIGADAAAMAAISGALGGVMGSMGLPTNAAERRTDNLRRLFTGLIDGFDLLKEFGSESLSTIMRLIGRLGKALVPVVDTVLDLAGAFGDYLSNLKAAVRESDGIKKFWESIEQTAGPIIDKIGDFISSIFSAIGRNLPGIIGALGEGFRKIGSGLKDVANIFGVVWESAKKLFNSVVNSDVFKGFTAALQTLWDTIKQVGGEELEKISKFFEDIFGKITSEETGEKAASAIEWVLQKLTDLITFITDHIGDVRDFIDTLAGASFEGLEVALGWISDTAVEIGKVEKPWEVFNTLIGGFSETFGKFVEVVSKPGKVIADAFGDISEKMGKFFEGMTLENSGEFLMNTGIAAILLGFAKLLTGVGRTIEKIPEGIIGVLEALQGTIASYQRSLNADAILKVAEAIGILALSIIALSFVPPEKLTDVTAALIALMLGLAVVMLAYGKLRAVMNPAKMASTAMEGIFQQFANVAKKIGKGLALMGLAAAIGILAIVISNLMSIEWDKAASQFAIATGVVVLLGSILALLMKIINKSGGTTIGTALSFITMALAIKMILASIMEVVNMLTNENGSMDWSKVGAAIAIIAVIGAAMTALALAMSKFTTSTSKGFLKDKSGKYSDKQHTSNSPLGFAVAILLIAAAFRLIMPALNEIAGYSEPQMNSVISVILSLGAILAAIMALSVWMAKTPNMGTGIAGMLVAVIAITTLVAAVAAIGYLNIDIVPGLIAMAAALGLFAAAILIFTKFPTLANNMLEVAWSLLVFGAACLAFGAGLVLAAKGLPAFIEAIADIGKTIHDRGGEIALALVAIIGVILTAIILSKSQFVSVVIEVGVGILDALGVLLQGLLKLIEAMAKPTFFTILTVISIVLTLLLAFAPQIVDKLVAIFVVILSSLGAVIMSRGGQIWSAIKHIIGSLLVIVGEVLLNMLGGLMRGFGIPQKAIDDLLKGAHEGLDTFKQGIIDDANKNIEEARKTTTFETTSAVDEFGDDTEKALSDQNGKVTNGIEEMLKPFFDNGINLSKEDFLAMLASKGLTDIPEELSNLLPEEIDSNFDINNWMGLLFDGGQETAKEEGEKIAEAEVEGLATGEELNREQGDKNETAYQEGREEARQREMNHTDRMRKDDLKQRAKEEIEEEMNALTIALDGTIGDLEKQGSNQSLGLIRGMRQNEQTIWEVGEDQTEYYSGGVASKEGIVEQEGVNLKNSLIAGTSGGYSSMYQLGADLGQGFANGIMSKIAASAAAAAELVFAAKRSVAEAQDSNSPSKVFMRLGSYAGDGFALGMLSTLGSIEAAGEQLVSTMKGAVESAMNTIDPAMMLDPVVSPVMNMDSIYAGASAIRGLSTNMSALKLASGFTVRSEQEILAESLGERMQGMVDDFNKAITDREQSATYNFEAPVVLNGREIARSSARYTKEELDRIQRNSNRKEGKL